MHRIALVFLGCCAISPLAFGQSTGDAATGRKLANEWNCLVCHGPDGNGNKGLIYVHDSAVPRIPRISAQPQAYFVKSMHDYKTGKRTDDNMQTLAEQLSDTDIRDLAAWYGSQTPSSVATYYDDPRN